MIPGQNARHALLHCLIFAAGILAGSYSVAQEFKVEVPTEPVGFIALLSADEQTHVVDSPAAGRAEFSLERATMRITWRVTFSGLTSPATGVHLHGAERVGGNAPILHNLAQDGMSSPLTGSTVITDAQLAYLIAGRTYVNIHTRAYPDGEIRGQIQRVPKAPF